jgi:hypothetical protein
MNNRETFYCEISVVNGKPIFHHRGRLNQFTSALIVFYITDILRASQTQETEEPHANQ